MSLMDGLSLNVSHTKSTCFAVIILSSRASVGLPYLQGILTWLCDMKKSSWPQASIVGGFSVWILFSNTCTSLDFHVHCFVLSTCAKANGIGVRGNPKIIFEVQIIGQSKVQQSSKEDMCYQLFDLLIFYS